MEKDVKLKKGHFKFDHEMTTGDLIDYLLTLDPDLSVYTSIFKPMEGLIYKNPVKFSQIKEGRDCLYLNNYLSR